MYSNEFNKKLVFLRATSPRVCFSWSEGIGDLVCPLFRGIYLASQKNSSPPPLKFFPVFVDFFAVF